MAYSSNIKETLDLLHKDIDLLQNQAEDNLPTPIKIEVIKSPWLHRSIESEFKNKSYYGGSKLVTTCEAVDKCLVVANNKIDAEVVKIEQIHKTNLPAIENNILIRKKVYMFMEKIGVRESYSTYEFKTSRSRNKTHIKHIAGFIADLSRVITVVDGYDGVGRSVNDYKRKLKDYADKLKQNILKEQREKQSDEKAKKKLKVLATFCVKYDLDAEAEEYDIREAILVKDKYLHLAYWLERNRGDWNDGYSYAETGLSGFHAETAEDNDIVADISSYIEDWDGDGRVFRDCEYNYNVLYKMADKALLKDLQTLQEYMEDY